VSGGDCAGERETEAELYRSARRAARARPPALSSFLPSLPPFPTHSARSKRLLGIKNVDVYALGLYVDPAAVKKVAAGKKAVDDALLAAVVGDAVPKTLRVVVTTGLMTRTRFLASVRETLAPALTKAGDPTAMDSFEALFASTEFRKGTDLAFSNVPGGGMAVQAGGRELGRLASKAFAPAFFDLYLGKEPVSVEGKKSMVAGLAGLVAE